ncbi:hypothetical protein [Niallia circulans]|uniref:hypothetical protein n=1 Tax=Niallia circulans TaxID=1397 RepID=UPI0015607156|nr:hypothetical protein [Niallia circulans]NRG32546.1 hypothetical protein [Niallia circulans]
MKGEKSVMEREKKLKEGTYCTNVLLRWLTTDLLLTNKRFKGYDRNTVLGLMPIGKNEVTMSLKNIASVSTSTKFHLKRFLFGLFFTFILGLPSFVNGDFFIGLVLILIGIVPLFNSYTCSLNVSNNGGLALPIEISILERGNLQEFANAINDTIAEVE